MPVPALLTMLDELIRCVSVSSADPRWDKGNRAVVEKLADWLGELGFTTEILAIDGQPHKANLIATRGSGPGGLVLAGHTDTVPFDEGRWQHNPLALTQADNRLYGLGATDMKGFFPIAIEAIRGLIDQPLTAPLIVLATADEESSMAGARQLAALGRPRARAAVIGEPTGLRPIRQHKGILMEAVTITGRAGHSSDPALGRNALEAMHGVMGELLQLRAEWQQRYRDPQFSVPVPTLNLGCIHGGDNPNRICGRCELHFDLRPLPGMDNEALRTALRERLQPVGEQFGVELSLRSLFEGVDAFCQTADSELVQIVERLTNSEAGAVAFATEGPFLQQLGMETVILGPGAIDQAHQPDEYMALDQVQPAIALLRQLIAHYCLG